MMNIKTIVSLLRKTVQSLLIVCLALYIFGFFASGMEYVALTEEFIEVMPFMIPFLSVLLFTFCYVNYKMVIKELNTNVYPYLLYTILIPTIVSGIFGPILMYILRGKFSFLITLNHMATSGAIVLFLALIHFIKYNYVNKNKNTQEALLNVETPYILILLYAIGLSLLNSVGQSILLFRFSMKDASLVFFDSIIIAIICWYFVRFFNKYLRRKFSSFMLTMVTILIIVVCMQPIITGIKYLQLFILGEEGIPFNRFTIFDHIRFNLFQSVYVVFCVLFYQFLYFDRIQSKERKEFKAELGKQAEKYDSLRRQLSPHFLFNNISVLTALIEENPQKAVHFSESLGNIYRHFLRHENEDVVLLKEALSFSKDYLELLKYRFEEAFTYQLPKINGAAQYIIPLALQQVIENVIKHNEITKETPIHVAIELQDDYLVVTNTKQKKQQLNDVESTGIENIKARYHFLTENKIHIEENDTYFTIKLPILNS